MRLIDADALIEKSLKDANCYMDNDIKHGYHNVQCLIYDAPTIDAVPVVRCKECKHHFYCCRGSIPVDDNGFCSHGERKEDE